MKSFVKMALISIAIGFGLSHSAFATCVTGCVESVPTTTTFSVGGGAQFAGFGGAVFTGKEGYAMVEKTGYSNVDVKLDAAGNLCGINCQSGNFTFTGNAGEHVLAKAGALSNQSGLAATATNQGSAMGAVTLQVQKTLK